MGLTWVQEATLRNPEGAKNMPPAPVCAAFESPSLDGTETACLPLGVGGMEHVHDRSRGSVFFLRTEASRGLGA